MDPDNADQLAAYRLGKLRGLAIAAELINSYMERFSLVGDSEFHARCMRDGISNAINMMSLGESS